MHVHRRSASRRDSFASTLPGEEYTVDMQCTVGGPDHSAILGHQIGKLLRLGLNTTLRLDY